MAISRADSCVIGVGFIALLGVTGIVQVALVLPSLVPFAAFPCLHTAIADGGEFTAY